MMPQGFFPLESVHPHTLGIWAEVFMCEYNGYSSNKIYKRCDQIVFLEVAVFMGYSYGAVAWLQSRNHFCESVHDRCVYTSSMGDKPEPMNTSWQHILWGQKLVQATWQIQQRANWHLNHDLSRWLGKPTLRYFISFVAQWQKQCYFAFVHLKEEVAWGCEI